MMTCGIMMDMLLQDAFRKQPLYPTKVRLRFADIMSFPLCSCDRMLSLIHDDARILECYEAATYIVRE